jgi:hypothetical protein
MAHGTSSQGNTALYVEECGMTQERPSDRAHNRFVLPETRAIALVGCFDMLATVYLLATHRAAEGNPVMAGILAQYGPLALIGFKALLLAVPIMIAEYARQHSPEFVPKALRIGLLLYVVLLLFAYRPLLFALLGAWG